MTSTTGPAAATRPRFEENDVIGEAYHLLDGVTDVDDRETELVAEAVR